MSSIVTAVFKATIGLLVNKGRDKAAERLKEGDVTEQTFRSVIVREIDDIKSKLDGLSRKDLLASISFFEEGIELLYEVFYKARTRSEGGEEPVQAACAEAFALAEEMRSTQLTGLDESAKRALANAKERFKDARREATRAFKNEALTTSDRILAMEYRVMATILETIDNPADAIAPCRVCIKEINSLSAVQNSFKVELRKGIMARFNKDGRGKIISSVCHVNRVVFDVTQAVGKEEPFWMWPSVDTEEGNIEPLRDGRVLEILRKQGMEHCSVKIAPWAFGFGLQGLTMLTELRFKNPCGMAMNSKGQFIITESNENKVKVFDRGGDLMDHFSLPVHKVIAFVLDVTVDRKDNVYVLVQLCKSRDTETLISCRGDELYTVFDFVVYVLNNNGEVRHQFSCEGEFDRTSVSRAFERESGMFIIGGFFPGFLNTSRPVYVYYPYNCPSMIVNSKLEVVIAGTLFPEKRYLVNVYENGGQFVRRFGEGLFTYVYDLALASDDRVIVLDGDKYRNLYVHMFSKLGVHLSKFQLEVKPFPNHRIAFHHASEHVVVAEAAFGNVELHVYTKNGELVRRTELNVNCHRASLTGFIVTAEGHVALLINGIISIVC